MKNENRDYSNYAFIIETEEILKYTECVSAEQIDTNKEKYTEEYKNQKGRYIGRGYRYNHDYKGRLDGGEELLDFWVR